MMKKLYALIILLTMFLTSCGDDGSSVNDFEQTPEILSSANDDNKSSSSKKIISSSSKENDDVIESSSSEEEKETKILKVLCLGNSITIYAPKENIGWMSNHGMAASSPQTDYVHVLKQMIEDEGVSAETYGINLSNWERTFVLPDDSVMAIYNADVIVIRLGENVENDSLFGLHIDELIQQASDNASNVLLTGLYWSNPDREDILVDAADRWGIAYVPISFIYSDFKEEVCPKEGDISQDTLGELYHIEGNFITTHPNDKEMSMIASEVFNKLKQIVDLYSFL